MNKQLYTETYRPQFHFTARRNWLNDPNGLVYYRGEYHLFFQHNPTGINHGNMSWGHAISRDLVHWQQYPDALIPDELGTVFSGSAVVDESNTTRFRTGRDKPLVAIYTAAGNTSEESKGQPFTQCLAYSTDRGRTWTKYAQNPVMPNIVGENRDPKVVWHAPTRRWIMALYLEGDKFALFSAPDLKTWTHLQDIRMPECSECPDFFELLPEGEESTPKWVFTAANGRYLLGSFDGQKFTQEAGPLQVDYGANFYAGQTYSDISPGDGRRIQIAWMAGGVYPDMPFNQQMSFPCVLTLHNRPEGLRLYRWPAKEIRALYLSTRRWRNLTLKAGLNPLAGIAGELWDIEVEIELQDAATFSLHIGETEIRYNVAEATLSCLDRSAPLAAQEDRISLRVLVDRTSLEVFGNGGQVSLTSCLIPKKLEKELLLATTGGKARIISLSVHQLRSAWNTASPDGLRRP